MYIMIQVLNVLDLRTISVKVHYVQLISMPYHVTDMVVLLPMICHIHSRCRALVGGLSTAGQRAVVTQTGALLTGPVISIFNRGNRNGASAQNGAASQTIGELGRNVWQLADCMHSHCAPAGWLYPVHLR